MSDPDVLDADTLGFADEAEGPVPVYGSVTEWVQQWLLVIVRPRTGGTRTSWCHRWWEHTEAVSRLGALWASWEVTNAEGGSAPSTWWVHHFGPQWAVITAPDGPFSACSSTKHNDDPEPLPSEGPPAHE